jgi:hypothetical protein
MASRLCNAADSGPQGERPNGDVFTLLGNLRECARRGDWYGAQDLAEALPQQPLPATIGGLGEYLATLQQTLIVTRTSRAHTAASLVRINAAAGFNRSQDAHSPPRQEFGETAEF